MLSIFGQGTFGEIKVSYDQKFNPSLTIRNGLNRVQHLVLNVHNSYRVMLVKGYYSSCSIDINPHRPLLQTPMGPCSKPRMGPYLQSPVGPCSRAHSIYAYFPLSQCTPSALNCGTVTIGTSQTHDLTLFNPGTCTLYYQLSVETSSRGRRPPTSDRRGVALEHHTSTFACSVCKQNKVIQDTNNFQFI